MQLHPAEFTIDEALVRALLRAELPSAADEPLERLSSTGTVHVLYRAGDIGVVRLPRTPEFADSPRRQALCVAELGPSMPLAVPRTVVLGAPTGRYPSWWSVVEWIEGSPASADTIDDPYAAAETLGALVRALRAAPTRNAPHGGTYRAGPLAAVDADTRSWVSRLPDRIDRSAVRAVWESCLSVGDSTGRPTWLHGDLRGDNLIARDGRLVAVIDWDGATVGDPSVDLLAGWWLFGTGAREVFRRESGAPGDDWERGRGWALQMAVTAIPYYRETNPGFVRQAHLALGRILEDR